MYPNYTFNFWFSESCSPLHLWSWKQCPLVVSMHRHLEWGVHMAPRVHSGWFYDSCKLWRLGGSGVHTGHETEDLPLLPYHSYVCTKHCLGCGVSCISLVSVIVFHYVVTSLRLNWMCILFSWFSLSFKSVNELMKTSKLFNPINPFFFTFAGPLRSMWIPLWMKLLTSAFHNYYHWWRQQVNTCMRLLNFMKSFFPQGLFHVLMHFPLRRIHHSNDISL